MTPCDCIGYGGRGVIKGGSGVKVFVIIIAKKEFIIENY